MCNGRTAEEADAIFILFQAVSVLGPVLLHLIFDIWYFAVLNCCTLNVFSDTPKAIASLILLSLYVSG